MEASDDVLRFNATTGEFDRVFVSAGNGGIDGPHGLTFGPDANGDGVAELYVSGRNSFNVVRYDGVTGEPLGAYVTSGLGELRWPEGLAFNPSGSHLYVASTGSQRVLKFDAQTGEYVGVAATATAPKDVNFGPDGMLHVATGNRILRYTENGVFVDDYISPGSGGLSELSRIAFGPDGNLYATTSGPSSDRVYRFGTESEAVLTVSLARASSVPVTVEYSTAGGSAIAGSDFTAATGSVTLAPGITSKTILVPLLDDATIEPDETFTVNLSNAVGGTIADGQGIGTIEDNDPVGPTLSISDVTVREGVDAQAAFTVNLGPPHTEPVTVNYATAEGTALAGINYIATTGTLTFAPGETQRTIAVPILNDGTTYPTETFTVNMSNAVGATIGDGRGIGTVSDDDISDFKWSVRLSGDGQMLETYLGNPVSPGESPLFTWPMNAKVPLPFSTEDIADDDDAIFIELPAGSNGPAGGILLDTLRGRNELIIKSGRVRIESFSTGGVLSTTVSPGAELITTQLQQDGLTIANEGHVTLLPGGETSRLTNLIIEAGGDFDLTDNALIFDYSGTSPVASLREKILSGRGGPGLGARWTGPGINSSTAAEANKNDSEAYSIGYVENAALPLGPYSHFRGQPVDDSSILIAYTRTGDANLDGLVNDDDVTIVGATYAPGVPQPHWALGDFDFNGFVDDDDVTLLGVFYDPATVAISLREMQHPLAEREVFDVPPAHREDYTRYALAVERLLADADEAFAPKRRQTAKLRLAGTR
jgi:hypothetical protein